MLAAMHACSLSNMRCKFGWGHRSCSHSVSSLCRSGTWTSGPYPAQSCGLQPPKAGGSVGMWHDYQCCLRALKQYCTDDCASLCSDSSSFQSCFLTPLCALHFRQGLAKCKTKNNDRCCNKMPLHFNPKVCFEAANNGGLSLQGYGAWWSFASAIFLRAFQWASCWKLIGQNLYEIRMPQKLGFK